MTSLPTPPRGIIPALPLGAVAAQRMPEPGNVLDGRYLLQEAIGSGGVAHVFKALHYRVRRQVAVKLLHQSTLGQHSLAPRFEHEALALAQLSHPNIVRLQDYGVTSGVQYLVMELVDGRTLREALDQDGAFPVERALSLTRQLLHALAYAHERGIVHRDLKPLNLVVQALPHQPEHLKVLDFGFAKFLPASELHQGAPVTHAGFAFGSPTYISPEQCTGDTVDGRADLYSVGVMLFEMLTGAPPFSGEVPELLRHHLQSPPPRLASVRAELAANVELQAVLDRALAKQRDERYASAAEFLAALDTLQRPSQAPTGISVSQPPAVMNGSDLSGLAERLRHQLAHARESLAPHAVAGRERAVRYALVSWHYTQLGSRYVWAQTKHTWRMHVQPAAARAAASTAQHAREGWQHARPRLQQWLGRAKAAIERLRRLGRKD